MDVSSVILLMGVFSTAGSVTTQIEEVARVGKFK
jgi:hypothetical protein